MVCLHFKWVLSGFKGGLDHTDRSTRDLMRSGVAARRGLWLCMVGLQCGGSSAANPLGERETTPRWGILTGCFQIIATSLKPRPFWERRSHSTVFIFWEGFRKGLVNTEGGLDVLLRGALDANLDFSLHAHLSHV